MGLNSLVILQGEVWLCNFEPQVGSEITKIRPAVVIDAGYEKFTRQIVPITSWQDKFKMCAWILQISNYGQCGLEKSSGINCAQIKSFSKERFIKRIGAIDNDLLFEIHQTIAETWYPLYSLTK